MTVGSRRVVSPRLLAILLLVFSLGLFRLTTQSFWYDEGFTWYLARLPLQQLAPELLKVNPIPFYYLLTYFWMKGAGASVYALRMAAVCGGVLAVVLCYRLGREMAGPRVGTLAALGLALSPMHLYYLQEARPYSWLVAWSLVVAILLYRATRGLSRREAIALACAQVLALFTQVWGIFTVGALNAVTLLAFLRYPRPRRHMARPWVLANILTLIVVIPWFWAARRTALATLIYFKGDAPVLQIITNAFQWYAMGPAGREHRAGIVLFELLLLLACAVLVANRIVFKGSFLLAGALSPLVGILLASIERSRYNARYIISALPFFFLLFALAWRALHLRSRRLGASFAGLLAALAFFLLQAGYTQYFDPTYYRPDFRNVSAYIAQHGNPESDGIVMVGGHFHPIIRYYLGDDTFPLYPIPDDVIHNVDDPLNYADLGILNEAARRHERLWLILWQRELADPSQIVLRELVERSERLPVGELFGEIDLLLFSLPTGVQFETSPEPAFRLNHVWERGLELEGFDLAPAEGSLPHSQPLRVRLYWMPHEPLEEDFFVSLQLIGADARLHAQADHIAYNDFYPPSEWQPEERLVDHYTITFPAELEPGIYQLILVLYDRQGERWLTPEGGEFIELSPRIEVTAP